METENQKLLEVQEQFSKYFLFLADRCKKLQRKCDKYVVKLQDTDELNVNIQKSGVRLLSMMKIFKGNMSVLISSIENDLKALDPNRNSHLFQEIYSKLLDYKTTVVSLENDNKYVFTKLCDKETSTEESITQSNTSSSSSTSDLDKRRSLKNSSVDCIDIASNIQSSQNSASETVISISGESDIQAGCSLEGNQSTKPEKTYNFSLHVAEDSDGEDTDDSWTDSLKPCSPTEVKTRLSPKRESVENKEDANDAEAVAINYEEESTPDDIFEDGHSTPKEENTKEETGFKGESNGPKKSKEVDTLFSEDINEESSLSLKSEESDMLFSEDSPSNATNPETSESHENGKSSESATNLEIENPNSHNHDQKLSAHADSNRSKSGSPCIFSENESDCSFETVNDSRSPYKTAEAGSTILKIPVEIDESKQSSGSNYIVASASQITKKTKPKSSKKGSSSQKLETSKILVESDSGNITNSQSSTASESTENSTSSLNDFDEGTKSPNSRNIEYQDGRNDEDIIAYLNQSDGQVESPNTKNEDDEDSAVANLEYFDDKTTKSPNYENREYLDNKTNKRDKSSVISNLNNYDDQIRSPNSEHIEWQDSSNEDDEKSDISNLKDSDERVGSLNSVNIESEHSGSDEDERPAIFNLNNHDERSELPNSANEECQDKRNSDDDYDIANIDFDERSESPNSGDIEDSDSSNDKDAYSAIAKQKDRDRQTKSPNSKSTKALRGRNDNDEVSVNTDLSIYDEERGSPICENIEFPPIRNDDGDESAVTNNGSINREMESRNSDKIEYQGSGISHDTESTITNINSSYEQEQIPNSENIDSDATEICDNETVEIDFKKAEDENIYSMATQVISDINKIEPENNRERSSCISDTVNKYYSPHDGNAKNDATNKLSASCSDNDGEINTIKSKYIERTSGEEKRDVSDEIRDVYSINTQDLSVLETDRENQSTRNRDDLKEIEAEDIYSIPTQVISNIDGVQSANIGDRSSCISDTVNKDCSPHDQNTEHKKLSGNCPDNTVKSKSGEENNDVSNEIGDAYSVATQELFVMETNSGNQSKADDESIKPDFNEKGSNDVIGEIENPFSVETVKLVFDEDVEDSDSQSSIISEKCSDFLTEHNYSCASTSDLDDSARNGSLCPNPEKEDSDSSEIGNEGVLKDLEKINPELNIEDGDSNTINMNLEAETDENRVASPTSPLERHITGDFKNSQTELVDSSYIYSEHNYSSCGSPGPQNSSSDMEDEVTENVFAKSVDRERSTDADSDETDIDRELNEDLVNESEDVVSQLEKDLANLDEIPDSQEDVALSQQSTKSYEFDISENVNCLGDLSDLESKKESTPDENIDIAQKDETVAEDIVKELENLLSEDFGDCTSEDDGTDITASDLDLSDVKSANVETSSTLGKMSNSQKSDSEKGQVSKKRLLIRLTDCLEKSVGIVTDYQSVDKSIQPLVIQLTNCLKDQIGHIEQRNAEESLETSKEQTALINSNIESTESLLDITMEEFLSDFQKDEKVVDSQSTIILDDDDIKPKLEVIQIDENELEETKPLDKKQHDIGDEILELLKEVPVPNLENADVTEQRPIQDNESDELKEAEDILKMMELSSSDDSSESDIDDNIHLLSDTSVEVDDRNEPTKDSENRMLRALTEHNMVSCYVDLKRLQLPEDDIVKYTRKLEDNIDWLCDLTTVNKRKGDCDLALEKIKRTKKIRRENLSTGHSSSSSSDDSDLEVCGYRSGTPVLPKPVEEKLDAFLANVICRDLESGNDSGSGQSGSETDDSSKKKQKKKTSSVKDGGSDTNIIDESDTDTNNERTNIGKEELLKKAWKHDPLLRGKLSSNSETENSNSEKSTNKRRKKRRQERENEFSVASDNLDSDSDLEGVREKNKSKLEENLISPIKRNIPSSDSSDSDSDIEFIPQNARTPLKEGEAAGPSPSQKGRRNIRALMSQESLAEATKRANKEETERIERLKDRHKVIETFSQSFSQSQGQDEEAVPFVLDVDEKTGETLVAVNPKITAKLKPHQKIGIQFMWDSCYESIKQMKKCDGSGCILAHCMGLGKTRQAIALIHTLFTYEETNTKRVLVVCPLSTVNNWLKEIKFAFKGCPEEKNFHVFSIPNKTHNKYDTVKNWWLRKKSLLILGYESFEILTNDRKLEKIEDLTKELILKALIDPGPDLVICDEGHLLRNKNALKSMALSKIRSKRRIILTGTPLQNNLLEYYHMVQFVKPDLLGNSKEFKTNFVNPITNGQYEDSTEDDIKLMMERTHVLHRLLVKTVQRIEDTELEIYLPKMMDHALFIQLSQVQVDLYNHFSERVKLKVDQKQHKGFLSEFAIFQYICTHPEILKIMERMRKKRIKEKDVITNEDDQPICHLGGWWKGKLPEDAGNKIEYGNKLVVLRNIIEACEEIGDKVLVFSQSLGELNLIEHFLNTIGTRKCPSWQKNRDYSRMDGTIDTENRTTICDNFNNPKKKTLRLLLMSTKVGGLGLNLTAANRVVIMTVNWNPSYDTQSVFRAYRFGQEKEVYVYRLIALDTMEEKVYHRTVTKLAIAHRVIDKHQVRRHYRRMHLQELYSCEPSADEGRPTPNVPEDQMLAKVILKLPCIFKFHEHKSLLENRPEDNLTEQELTSAWEAWKNNETAAQAPPSKSLAVPHPKTQPGLQPKSQTVPALQNPTVPELQNLAVPELQNLAVPALQNQAGPSQRTPTVPLQRNQAIPLQRNPAVPLQRNQAVPLQRTQTVPVPRMLVIPFQMDQAAAPQLARAGPPPLTSAMAAVNFLVGRAKLNQLANTNLSRMALSNVSTDHESKQYFFPKKNNVIASSDLSNLPNTNLDVTPITKDYLQTSSARNSQHIGKGDNHSAKLGLNLPPTKPPATSVHSAKLERKLPPAKTPATSMSNKQILHNGQREGELNPLRSPTIPLENGSTPRPISNTLGPAAGGDRRRIGPLTTGPTIDHKNMKTLQETPKTSSPIAQLPNRNKVKSQTPRILLKTQRKLVPSRMPLDSQANIKKNPLNSHFTKSEGDSPNDVSNMRNKQKNKNSATTQNKKDALTRNNKDAPQRLGLPLSVMEPNNKRPTKENAIPSRNGQNSLVNKRKIEVDSPIGSKKRKVASKVPSSGNRNIQTIIVDDGEKRPKKNKTGYSSDSRVASISLDDDEISSESGSLSSAIINTLKLSGVTIRKAPGTTNDVITLD